MISRHVVGKVFDIDGDAAGALEALSQSGPVTPFCVDENTLFRDHVTRSIFLKLEFVKKIISSHFKLHNHGN